MSSMAPTYVGRASQPVLDGLGRPSYDATNSASHSWHFWLTTGLLGVLFFMTNHDVLVSRLPDYAHYDDSVISVAVGTNFIRRITFFLLAGLGIWFAFFSAGKPWKFNPWIALPILGYVAWCCGSVLWSAEPGMGLKRVITLVCFYLCALGIGRRFEMRDLCWMMFVIIAGYFALGLAMELALGTFRPWQSGHRFAGTLHPNSQAAHLSMMSLAAFALAPREAKWGKWLYAAMAIGLVFVVLTRSRTNLAGALLALTLVAALRSSFKSKLIGVYLAVLAGLTGIFLLMLSGKDPFTQLFEAAMLGREDDVASLSGRGFIWPICWEFIGQRPWLGYGYGSFWTPLRIEQFLEELQFSMFEAHNGYLELLLGTGIIGCGLYVASMVTSLVASAYNTVKTRESSYALLFGVMVFAFIYANSESGMMGINLVTLLMTSQMLNLALRAAAAAQAAEGEPRAAIA
ncbi:MAG: O-antigen ligase family protein [Pirellulaceae bacterium]|nr:O-antigen ligase family protein [Pirellulaceae bacterium]